MAAPTTVQSMSGATLAISANLPTTYDAAGYGSTLMVYTLIGAIENYGNHGATATITEFTPVDTAIVTKVKGAKNYGTKSLTLGSIPSDAGQVILDAAMESTNRYSAKLTYPSGAIHYLDVLIAKTEFDDGAVNDIQKRNVDMAICRKPVIVAAT
jgi:hypothetical protein